MKVRLLIIYLPCLILSALAGMKASHRTIKTKWKQPCDSQKPDGSQYG